MNIPLEIIFRIYEYVWKKRKRCYAVCNNGKVCKHNSHYHFFCKRHLQNSWEELMLSSGRPRKRIPNNPNIIPMSVISLQRETLEYLMLHYKRIPEVFERLKYSAANSYFHYRFGDIARLQ